MIDLMKKTISSYKNIVKKLKIDFLCTPFDIDAVKFLKDRVKFFKVSSSDITNFQLLRCVAKTKKPIFYQQEHLILKKLPKR